MFVVLLRQSESEDKGRLDHNNLSGDVISLMNSYSLTILNVSYNNLVGEIPMNDNFSRFSQDRQANSGTSEFHGMKAVVVDTRPVRANVSKYHIQRFGIHVEVVADLNQCLHTVQSGNCRIDMVLLEWEIWDKDSGLSAIFLDKLRDMKARVSPWFLLLSNSISSSRMSGATTDATGPFVIMKPLRASMLVASLQRVMGVGNQISCSNGESPSLSLRNLLRGRKILVVDDNKVNLRVAEGALKKYGADVVCTDSGEKAIALLRPPHDFNACFMDIQMPRMDGNGIFLLKHLFFSSNVV